MTRLSLHLKHLILYLLSTNSCVTYGSAIPTHQGEADSTTKVLILGGGMAGVIAARTLHTQGMDDFLLIEARDELGGRMQSTNLGDYVVELGPNWIEGTQTGNGPVNPIWALAKKYGLNTQTSSLENITTFDETGQVDFMDVLNTAANDFDHFVNYSGQRLAQSLVDLTGRGTYDFIGKIPGDAHERAAEYLIFDWEYAQTPLQSSGIATARNSNATFEPSAGGFSDEEWLSIDQRGYKTIIQQEANSFLEQGQLRLNTLVKSVEWSASGVKAVFNDGTSISADYAICTFSLGVLKMGDVKFEPDFPDYKKEALASMTMGTYTKIFLQFPQKFWFSTEFALYADLARGRYPVWQSLDMEGFLPGCGIIFATVTGDYSERVEALSDEEIKTESISILRTMFPNVTIPEPLAFKFHRWFNDPLYRGSYSNWPPSFLEQHHDNIRANLGRLYFAGEATSRDYYGYLHGAYFEGQDMANMVAKCIRGESCVSLPINEMVKNS